ncbi:hypothetical protein M407DRAFT_23974, partial [Tulasnella calospora MUT 4182]
MASSPSTPQLASVRISGPEQDHGETAPPDLCTDTPPEDDRTSNCSMMSNSRLPPEVLYIIFALLQDSLKDRAAAALVCRSWSDAALDELWRSLPSFLPLLKLLGPFSYINQLALTQAPQTHPTAQTWDRFKCYGARVREIIFDDGPSPFDQKVLARLI